jgi:SOS response regulatory protein OraA/RecX
MTAKEARNKLEEKINKSDLQEIEEAINIAIEEAIDDGINKVLAYTDIPKNDKNKARVMNYLVENGFSNIIIASRVEHNVTYEGSKARFLVVSFEF